MSPKIQIDHSITISDKVQLIKDQKPSEEYKKAVEEANRRIIEDHNKQKQTVINSQNYFALY